MNCPRPTLTKRDQEKIQDLMGVYGVARLLEAVDKAFDHHNSVPSRAWKKITEAAATSAMLVYSLPHADE